MIRLFPLICFALLGVMALAVTGCGKLGASDDEDESVSEVGAGNMASAANSSDSTSANFAFRPATSAETFWAQAKHLFNPAVKAWAAGICPTVRTATCDENGDIVLEYDSCSFGGRGMLVWEGSQKLDFDSLATCQARSASRGVPVSGSLLRTFGGNIDADPTTVTYLEKQQLIIDTEKESGYANPVSGGVFVSFGLEADEAMRTIEIRGVRHVRKSLRSGETRWDMTVSSDPEKPLKVVGAGKNKEILSGSVSVQHNLAEFMGTTNILEKLTFSEDCCHPTSGKVETVFSGSKSGSQTLEFTSSCGIANLIAADGSSASILLRHCF